MARTRSAKPAVDSSANAYSEKEKGYTGNGDKIEDYGDQSSSYWPEGWNFDRYINAEQDELLALPNKELEKLLVGFRDVLGNDGNTKMVQALDEWEGRKQKESEATSTAQPVVSLRPDFAAHEPNWLKFYGRFKGQDWGFVAFKTGVHKDEQTWSEYKEKFDAIVRLPFRADEQLAGVKEAEEHFSIRWIEDWELERADAKQIQEKFAETASTLPAGLAQQLCFAATPQSVSHLLGCQIPDASSQRWRSDPPYILAVSATSDLSELEEDHEEREWFQETFKVAAETIVDELWSVLEGLSWPVTRVTRGLVGVRLVDGEEVDAEADEDPSLEQVWWSSAPSPERLRKRHRRHQ